LKPNRYIFSLIGAVFFGTVLFFFRLPLSQLLDKFIVKCVFASFESGFRADVFLLIMLLVLAVWVSKETSQQLLFKFMLYGSVFYVVERFGGYWTFTHAVLFPPLAYWDIIYLNSIICFFLSYVWLDKKNQQELSVQGFIEDSAVIRAEDDHFRRKVVAAEIARLILLTNNRKSFAIGILGEYGSGKTSFLNLIDLELKEKQLIKVAFNPWSAGNPETIRREFFDLLAREAAEVSFKVSSLIYSYGRKLASFDSRSLAGLNWMNFFGNKGSVQGSGEYEQINKILGSTRRKIIITIDDLDRLHPTEISEVLKIIRNTADFANVFYLVGYDKAYVQGALKFLSEAGSLDYLDKIFQLEIPLPKREEDDLLNKLQEHLKELISEDHYATLENSIIPNGLRSRYEKAYTRVLRQGRDVIRFINGFKIIYKLIGDEVDFECLLLLELIKFRFPTIYDLIYERADTFLYESPVRSTHGQYLSPRMVKFKGTEIDADEISVFRTYLEELGWLSTEDVSLLNALFMKLFKGSRYHGPEAKNSISYPLYFEIYFRYRLSQNDLSDKDFKAALTSGNMHEYMVYCASHGLHKELMVRLMQEDISKDQRHFEQVIRWIFSFGRTYVEKEGMFRFDYNALVSKIYNYYNQITDSIYGKDTAAYADFIRHLFSIAQAPFLFENELIYHLKKKGDHFVLPTTELTVHQLSYFSRMADSSHGLSEDTLWLFWGAREYYTVPADERGAYYERWRFESGHVTKMKSYLASKDSKEFLKFSIEQDMRERSQVYIYKQIMEMFDGPSEYRKLIADNTLLNDDIKREYLELFDKLASTDFKQYVEMKLKTELRKAERS
jgi:hypothetical protein